MRRSLAGFRTDVSRPRAAQERSLSAIVARNAETEFGRSHHFERLAGLTGERLWREYRRSLPIRAYAGFESWLGRMRAGEENVLTPGRPDMFSLTSGTASRPKFCPVTRAFIREHHRQHLLWLYHCCRDHPEIAGGAYLFTASPAEAGRTAGGIPYGAMSGRQLSDQSIPIRRRLAAPAELFALEDPGARWINLLLFALARPELTVVSALNPSTLIILAERLTRDGEELTERLESGRLAGEGPKTESLSRRLRVRPGRIRALREILRSEGRIVPAAAWPRLALILTWQGGSAALYQPRLRELWGDTPQRCLGLRASEGTFSIPLRDGDPSGVLAVGGHAMEFLPASDQDPEPGAVTLLADELEKGGLYRLVTTTSGGFYRYDLGDQVRVTGFCGRTPEIAFERRSGAFLSATGEKVSESQAVAALRAASRPGPSPNGFTLAWELRNGQAGYVLALELPGGEGELTRDGDGMKIRMRTFVLAFDAELRRLNCEYDAKRKDGRLSPPRALLLADRAYENWRARLAKGGRPDGQLKLPVLAAPPGPGKAPLKGCPVFDNLPLAAEF